MYRTTRLPTPLSPLSLIVNFFTHRHRSDRSQPESSKRPSADRRFVQCMPSPPSRRLLSFSRLSGQMSNMGEHVGQRMELDNQTICGADRKFISEVIFGMSWTLSPMQTIGPKNVMDRFVRPLVGHCHASILQDHGTLAQGNKLFKSYTFLSSTTPIITLAQKTFIAPLIFAPKFECYLNLTWAKLAELLPKETVREHSWRSIGMTSLAWKTLYLLP
jgi:hypothetical protein